MRSAIRSDSALIVAEGLTLRRGYDWTVRHVQPWIIPDFAKLIDHTLIRTIRYRAATQRMAVSNCLKGQPPTARLSCSFLRLPAGYQ